MAGIVTGILENARVAGELGQKLSNYGKVSVVSNKTPASDGPLKGVSIGKIPQTLMSDGEDSTASNYTYQEIENDYSFVAVEVNDNEIEVVKKLFSDWGAKNIQYAFK